MQFNFFKNKEITFNQLIIDLTSLKRKSITKQRDLLNKVVLFYNKLINEDQTPTDNVAYQLINKIDPRYFKNNPELLTIYGNILFQYTCIMNATRDRGFDMNPQMDCLTNFVNSIPNHAFSEKINMLKNEIEMKNNR